MGSTIKLHSMPEVLHVTEVLLQESISYHHYEPAAGIRHLDQRSVN